ncbi:MAG: hypothetical protein AAGI07_19980, partial [Bacteroidota bacterium]
IRSGFLANIIVRIDCLFFSRETVAFSIDWCFYDYSIGISLTFNLTHGNYLSSLRLSGMYHYLNVSYDQPAIDRENSLNLFERNGPVNSMEYRLRFSRSRITALQHIQPRFAQIFDVRYRSTFVTNRNKGDVFTASANLFFPGFFRTHSFNVSSAYQNEGIDETYQFRDNFVYPRGYASLPHDEINRFSFNYTFPLVYPDLAVAGPLAFLQRIKINPFFDIAWVTTNARRFSDFPYLLTEGDISELSFSGSQRSYKSLGAELTFDMRLLRLLDANLGVRYSYLMDVEKTFNPFRNEHQFDFIIISIGG